MIQVLICQPQVNSDSLWIHFSLSADLNLGSGITVPAGAILVVPLDLVHMDASVWGNDAGQFNPHRFLKKDVDLGGLFSPPPLSSHFSVLRNTFNSLFFVCIWNSHISVRPSAFFFVRLL